MSTVYICSDNHTLAEVTEKIQFTWESKYIGRHIIREKYDELFDHNGYYPEDEDYLYAGINLNLNPTVENGIITEIGYYKVKDNSSGHGRPSTEDRALGKKDIKIFTDVLDRVTEDYIEKEYAALCDNLRKLPELYGGYRLNRINKSGISLIAPSGSQVSMTKTKIVRGLYISHFYIDVLDCKETLEMAPDFFAQADIPVYLAIYSAVDSTSYAGLDHLRFEAQNRALRRTADDGYTSLLAAVKKNDFERVCRYAEYARFVYWDRDTNETFPLLIAVQNNNLEIAQELIRNKAFTTQSISDESGKVISPLFAAAKHQNYEMMKLLVNHHGADSERKANFWKPQNPTGYFDIQNVFRVIAENIDLEALRIILPKAHDGGFEAYFDPAMLPFSLMETAVPLAEILNARICWSEQYIRIAYDYSVELCKKMLKQGSERKVIDYLISLDEYELLEICLDRHKYIQNVTAFSDVYLRDPKWYALIKAHTRPDFHFMELRQKRDQYLGKLIVSQQYDTYMRIVECQNWGVPLDSLSNGFVGDERNDNISPKLFNFYSYVLDHMDYKQEYHPGWSSSYDCGFDFFSDSLYKKAPTDICKRCLTMYPLIFIKDNHEFCSMALMFATERHDDMFEFSLKMKMESNESERYLHYFTLFDEIIRKYRNVYAFGVPEEEREKAVQLEKANYLEVLRRFLSVVPREDVTRGMLMKKYRSHSETNTLLDYVIAERISDSEMLRLFE